MEGYGPETYGERIADVYDDWYGAVEETMVDRLAELAGGGAALELGIGTGRVALPLLQRGVEVQGIDASPAMVERLRAKPGGDRIPVTIGDLADLRAPGRFRLVYVVFNTFFALPTQADQVRAFRAAARCLAEDGRFVMEAFVPDVTRFERGQQVEATGVSLDAVSLDVTRFDPVDQTIVGQHVVISGAGIRLVPVSLRFCYPSELDLMAELAGLRLIHRWGGWDRAPYTGWGRHVSVWVR
jgi:SAM-dependent methyltransferase